jgi:ClpP class serine protease
MRVLAIRRASIGELRAGEGLKPERTASVIDVYGPLYKDMYEVFVELYSLALSEAGDGGTVSLAIDSPGGYVVGCFEATYDLRRIRALYPKCKVIAFSDGMLCSGAYAIAAAATSADGDEIVVTPQADVGSIGVLASRVEIDLERDGVTMHYFTWPEDSDKAAGYPGTEMSDAEAAQIQSEVTALGETFAALIAETRGLSVADVAALRARTFLGSAAVEAGLADRIVQSRSDLATPPINEEDPMPDDAPAPAPSTPPTPDDAGASTPASSSEVAALREELRSSRVGAMLAARPDITPELRALLAPQSPVQVEAMLAAVPLPRKTVTTAVDPIAPGTGGESPDTLDDKVPDAIVSHFNAYIPRKPIAARRKVERDNAHLTVRIR